MKSCKSVKWESVVYTEGHTLLFVKVFYTVDQCVGTRNDSQKHFSYGALSENPRIISKCLGKQLQKSTKHLQKDVK